MKSKPTHITAILALVAAATIAQTPIAPAQTPPGAPHTAGPVAAQRGEVWLRILQLGLTSQQVDDIKSILKLQRETVVYDLKRLASEQRALREIIKKNPQDEQAIRAQVAKRAEIETQLALTRARVSLQIQKVLTPEQREKSGEIFALIDTRVDQAIERFSQRLAGL